MTIPIPFLNFFKKVKDQALAGKEQSTSSRKQAKPVEKPSSERFSKTVMPNATRSLSPQDSFGTLSRPSSQSAPRTFVVGATAPIARPSDLPPAVALALEPMVERVVTLDLADIASQIPPNYIKPLESIDGTRRILLKAAEVEKGMTHKRPAVSLATVYEQVPEIFLRAIAPSDQTQVHLPFAKVLEQFASLQVRSDQERHQAVPQVETPFLKVTLEDNTKFGTTTEEPVGVDGDLPRVRIQPATAEALAAAEPELATPNKPTRISIEISPNGTGGSAPESVPASSEPSVPTSFLKPSAPTRIPFKLAVPGNDLPSQHDPCSTEKTSPAPEPSKSAPTPAAEPAATAPPDDSGATITLALKPILRGLPPSHFTGDTSDIPAEAQIELPFSLIEPQLATGRIIISPATFSARLPEEYQSQFKTAEATDVLLPLQEVLKNLPAASLQMRKDQEHQESGPTIETPFSAKAEEDAKRFNMPASQTSESEPSATAGGAAIEPAAATPAAKKAASSSATSSAAPTPATQPKAPAPAIQPEPASQSKLQELLETKEILDDKAVVRLVNKLPGIKGSAFMFGDGLSLAGNLPPEYKADGLCAMAPSLIQRIEKHLTETNLGPLRGMTLSSLKGSITFFMHENLCLAALHESAGLTSEVQEKLSQVVQELSHKYSSPV